MGTVRSQPELVIKHLVKGCSQPCEHRWQQSQCPPRVQPSLPSCEQWQLQGEDLCLEMSSFRALSEPWFSGWGKRFLLDSFFITRL